MRSADKIVVLSGGRVVKEGGHAELMGDVGGVYWRLAEAQRVEFEETGTGGGTVAGAGTGAGIGAGIAKSPLGRVEGRSMDIMEEGGKGEEGKDEGEGRSFLSSFGTLIVESARERKGWYAALAFGVLIAGGEFRSLLLYPLARPCHLSFLPLFF